MIETPFELPCGAVLANRIAKAAMSEQLSTRSMLPGRGLRRLYARWLRGGAGMLLTGNVMVDRRYVESVKNVVLEPDTPLEPFRAWADVADGSDTALWVQLNHPGRQCPRYVDPNPPAPSAVDGVDLFRALGAFGRPRAMDAAEIEDVVDRFGSAAGRVRETGFSGVQLHAAHGYLVSQFLSPLTNRRRDEWGGDLAARARFLLAVVARIRAAVGDDFPVSVKLNSADFQRGGFDEADSLQVLRWLAEAGVDLVELSGGNYESKAMFDLDRGSTGEREAYFLDFARRARAEVDVPLMVTGGFRSRAVMERALREAALDVVGMARPFANDPDVAAKLIAGDIERAARPTRWLGGFGTRTTSEAMLSVVQMALMSRGLEPSSRFGALAAAARIVVPGRR